MSLDEPPLVGSARSRELHHTHPGLRAVVLDPAEPARSGTVPEPRGDLSAALAELGVQTGHVTGLAALAEVAAERDDAPLLVAAGDLRLSAVALLDVVDGPSAATAAVTLEPSQPSAGARAAFAPVRVSRSRRVESSGTARHTVGAPNGYAVGLVRVAAPDRARAAELWHDAAAHEAAHEGGASGVDLALLALVRGGLVLSAAPLGLYACARGEAHVDGAPGSPWQQRLRSSSRGNDGAFSKAVVRPVSRRVTAFGLRHDWRPNVVTVVSLALGLLAAALVLLGGWWAWALAAVLLQASLVVDCVDGEIARFTRSYSSLGAWLDGVSDRVKEFAVIAAVTVVGVREGHDLWGLSIGLVAVLTMRQMEDQGYHARLRAAAERPTATLPLDQVDDGSDGSAVTAVPAPATGRRRLVDTVKQVLHVPIAERYLIMSLGLLTGSAVVLLVALSAAVLVALAWTHVGRIARAVAGRDGFVAERPDDRLALLLDLGPLARRTASGLRLPVAAAWLALGLVAAAFALMLLDRPAGSTGATVVVVLVAVAALLLGPGCAGAARSRLGWQLPGWVAAAEAALVMGAAGAQSPSGRWVAFAWFGAVAWHLYDLTYRVRETGHGPARWVSVVTFGSEGRMLLVALWWAVASLTGWPLGPPLVVGAGLMLAVWVGESRYSWRPSTERRPDSRRSESGRTRR